MGHHNHTWRQVGHSTDGKTTWRYMWCLCGAQQDVDPQPSNSYDDEGEIVVSVEAVLKGEV